MKNRRGWLLSFLSIFLLLALLVWALKNASLVDIWAAIVVMHPWQLAILTLLNVTIYVLFSFRWWLIIRTQSHQVPFWPLVFVRFAVFGISYFTFGPQVGGEAFQVLALQRRYGFTYSRATASVLIDKLLEFLVNFLLLALGLAAILGVGLVKENGNHLVTILIICSLLFSWPPIHIALMYKRIYPLTVLLYRLSFISKKSRPVRFLCASEWLAGNFCQRHPGALLGALGVSLVAGLGMLCDYALMISYLGIQLPFWKIVAGWTAGWLSFLVPLPGGLGALEASQVFALGVFGYPASTAIGLTLLMRARDLFIGGTGLFMVGSEYIRVK